MPTNDRIKEYYLKRLAEYRKAEYSDDRAAAEAEKDTIAKYGRVPD